MDFNTYQKESHKTAEYPDLIVFPYSPANTNWAKEPTDASYTYATLGLVGEAGEVAEKVKKIIRNKNGKINQEDKIEIAKELGDVLWYIAELATSLKISLNDIAESNIFKLQDRKKRDVIKSKGDNR